LACNQEANAFQSEKTDTHWQNSKLNLMWSS
jgi:hypothetical protein